MFSFNQFGNRIYIFSLVVLVVDQVLCADLTNSVFEHYSKVFAGIESAQAQFLAWILLIVVLVVTFGWQEHFSTLTSSFSDSIQCGGHSLSAPLLLCAFFPFSMGKLCSNRKTENWKFSCLAIWVSEHFHKHFSHKALAVHYRFYCFPHHHQYYSNGTIKHVVECFSNCR